MTIARYDVFVLLLNTLLHSGGYHNSHAFVISSLSTSATYSSPCGSTINSRRSNNGISFMVNNHRVSKSSICLMMNYNANNDADDSIGDEGMDLAAEFFKTVKGRGMENLGSGLEEDDDDDEDEDSDEGNEIFPVSEMNKIQGMDTGKVGKLAGNVTTTNKEIYSSLKERVLESPSSFSSLTKGSGDDDDDDDDYDYETDVSGGKLPYIFPLTYPDSGLTAGEVVEAVLAALNHNHESEKNEGVKILYAYSSDASVLKANPDKAPTEDEYLDFLSTTDEYKILLNHDSSRVIIEKADYSYDRKKSYFTVRLYSDENGSAYTTVNFILSTKGSNEDDCWLIDSILIRPEGMRRRGRR